MSDLACLDDQGVVWQQRTEYCSNSRHRPTCLRWFSTTGMEQHERPSGVLLYPLPNSPEFEDKVFWGFPPERRARFAAAVRKWLQR